MLHGRDDQDRRSFAGGACVKHIVVMPRRSHGGWGLGAAVSVGGAKRSGIRAVDVVSLARVNNTRGHASQQLITFGGIGAQKWTATVRPSRGARLVARDAWEAVASATSSYVITRIPRFCAWGRKQGLGLTNIWGGELFVVPGRIQ